MPDFWYRAQSVRSTLLRPLASLYGAGADRLYKYRCTKADRLGIPVVCVGNLTVGGTGKTPVVRALRSLLYDFSPVHVLTRGYRGDKTLTVKVDPAIHTAEQVGDEALLHAMDGPVWKGADRRITGAMAEKNGARLILMDDGLQNPLLTSSLSICVISRETGFGNGLMLPAGPLRENPSSAWPRIDAVITTGDPSLPLPAIPGDIPVFNAKFALFPPDMPKTDVIHAFAGIAHPERFFRALKDMGYDVSRRQSFADHYAFSMHELDDLIQQANNAGATLVTTEKDYVRIPKSRRMSIKPVLGQMQFSDPEKLLEWVQHRLSVEAG